MAIQLYFYLSDQTHIQVLIFDLWQWRSWRGCFSEEFLTFRAGWCQFYLQRSYLSLIQQRTRFVQFIMNHSDTFTRVGVFVYGDIGRSPRMQNHALELSKTHQVYFMGYIDSAPRTEVTSCSNIHLVDLQIPNLQVFRKISFYLYAFVRIVSQIFQILFLLLLKYRSLQFILIQNPPSIPNLFAIWLATLCSKTKIIIDFHNYGYTILGLSLKNRFFLKAAETYQKYFSRKAHSFLCVSDKMREDLMQKWGINAVTLYDRPVRRNMEKGRKESLLQKYGQVPRKDNQLFLVSSTSWTKDEDFSILLDALQMYDKQQKCTKILRTFITGKGPQKQKYINLIKEKESSWKKISITTLWLDADDYPVLLSICDLGICLHYSSSGLDLPMKVVDMFGAGIPVLAINFPALPELVKDGKNGFVFDSRDDLAQRLISLNEQQLKRLRGQAEKQSRYSWSEEWRQKFPSQFIK